MYKNKTKQRESVKKAVQKHRNETRSEQGITKGITLGGRDIVNKLTDPIWRTRLTKLCCAFENSHHPEYKEEVNFLDDNYTNLSTACDWLEVTG